jgi:Icc-related predicted phosphoesterase
MIITVISDTHGKHNEITQDLPGGDLLLHAGDISSMGYQHEVQQFCKWFNNVENYTHKIFIAGNHDWGFQNNVEKIMEIVNSYKTVTYIQDETISVGDDKKMVNVYGSPWQPEFYNWAFNLPKNGNELAAKWDAIPDNTDILITHGPAFGVLDTVAGKMWDNLGCQLLTDKIKTIKPKIHLCGHIHSGYGYFFDGDTHFLNASVLNEAYQYTNKPLTFEWNPDTNEINFL